MRIEMERVIGILKIDIAEREEELDERYASINWFKTQLREQK